MRRLTAKGEIAQAVASYKPKFVTPAEFAALAPLNGDEVYLIVDASAGINWHLRYNAGSASAYKWEFIGGPSLSSEVATPETVTATAYSAMATTGPSVTLPRAGDYEIDLGATISHQPGSITSANRFAYMSFDIGGTAAAEADRIRVGPDTTGAASQTPLVSAFRKMTKLALAAVALVSKYHTDSGNVGAFENRRMSIRPIRIS